MSEHPDADPDDAPEAGAATETEVLIPVPMEYDETQAEAFRAGFHTCAQLNAQANQTYVRAAAAAIESDASVDAGDGADADDDTCSDCGSDLIDAFGGAVCPTCGPE